MAEMTEAGSPAPAAGGRGGGGGNVLTRKLGPAPMWLWMLAGLGGALAWVSIRKNKSSQGPGGAAPSSATTNAGSLAAQTPPFIIQNYTNPGQAAPVAAPKSTAPNTPTVIAVGHNEPVQEVVNWAQKNGFPNFTWSDFWALNPNIPGLVKDPKGNWILSGWGTPITINKPGYVFSGKGGISEDVKPK